MKFHRLSAVVLLAACGGVASAQISAIFCNVAGKSNNAVPTLGGAFAIGTSSSSAFDRAFLSPDGTKWILGAISEAGTDDKDLVIVGGGLTAAGAMTVAVEDSATSFDGARTYSSIDQQMGINNAGQYAFGADLDGATTDDEIVVTFDGVSQAVTQREGTPSPIGGQNFGSTLDSVHILDDGTARFRAVLSPSTTKHILGSGSLALAETDVTVPAGQLVAPDQSLDNLASNRFVSSSDGMHYMYKGDLNVTTTTDDVMVVDGRVVGQEGAPLPGGIMPGVNLASLNGDTGSQQMSANGAHWMYRAAMADGSGATATDVVIHNSALAAATGLSIFTGSTEVWDDTNFSTTFFLNTVNSLGASVIGGLTNNPDLNLDAVLVYTSPSGISQVLARESDPVDLDGNGLFDDDAFIDVFGNDDGVLSDDGYYYFVAGIQNGSGAAIGNAFLVVHVPTPGALPVLLGAAALGARRRRR